MEVSKEFIEVLEHFEGFRSEPYQDTGGKWTIGIGSTITPSGQRVTAKTPPITYEEAVRWKQVHLEKRTKKIVDKYLKGLHVNQWEYDVICSMVYNSGPIFFTWSWFKAFKDAQGGKERKVYSKAQKKTITNSFMSIIRDAKGNKLRGLRRRKMCEAIYFFTGKQVFYAVSPEVDFETKVYTDKYAFETGKRAYEEIGI